MNWLDDTIDFDTWLAAWCAAWRIGESAPTIIIDYNGIEEYPWQAYHSDGSAMEYNGRTTRAGASPEQPRRRLTNDQLMRFLDAAVDLGSPPKTTAPTGIRVLLSRVMRVDMANGAWNLYQQHLRDKQ